MKVQGGCHCGHLRYEAEVDPSTAMLCHCTDCQQLSGTAFRTVVLGSESDFHLLSGTPKVYMKMAQSGTEREQVFCPECGTQIYAAPVADGKAPRPLGIRIGSCDQRREIAPMRHVWSGSALDWMMDLSTPEAQR